MIYIVNSDETLTKINTVKDLIDGTKSYCFMPVYQDHCLIHYPVKLDNIKEVLIHKDLEKIKIELKIDLKHLVAVIDPKKVSEKQLNIIREYRRKQVVKQFIKQYSVENKILMPAKQLLLCRCEKKIFILYKGRTLELIEGNELIPVFQNLDYPLLEVKTGDINLTEGRFAYVKYDNFAKDISFKNAKPAATV